jgi:hypothetical protein
VEDLTNRKLRKEYSNNQKPNYANKKEACSLAYRIAKLLENLLASLKIPKLMRDVRWQ